MTSQRLSRLICMVNPFNILWKKIWEILTYKRLMIALPRCAKSHFNIWEMSMSFVYMLEFTKESLCKCHRLLTFADFSMLDSFSRIRNRMRTYLYCGGYHISGASEGVSLITRYHLTLLS